VLNNFKNYGLVDLHGEQLGIKDCAAFKQRKEIKMNGSPNSFRKNRALERPAGFSPDWAK
jgi:hypothetical protein